MLNSTIIYLFCIETKKGIRYLLYEETSGTFKPVSEIRPDIKDYCSDLEVITNSILQISGKKDINFTIPHGFDEKKFLPLDGPNIFFVREQLGLLPG